MLRLVADRTESDEVNRLYELIKDRLSKKGYREPHSYAATSKTINYFYISAKTPKAYHSIEWEPEEMLDRLDKDGVEKTADYYSNIFINTYPIKIGFVIDNGYLESYLEEPGVTKVTIPSGVTTIGKHSFANCTNIKSAIVSEGVQVIEQSVFSGCTSLSKIELPNSLIELDDSFWSCDSLKTIRLPDNIQKVGSIFGTAVGYEKGKSIIYRGVKIDGAWLNSRNLQFAIELIRDLNFKVNVAKELKYGLIWKMYEANPNDARLIAKIKKSFSVLFKFAIEEGLVESVQSICDSGKFLSSKNIDKYIQIAISARKSEIYVILLNYKNTNTEFKPRNLFL